MFFLIPEMFKFIAYLHVINYNVYFYDICA